MNITRGQSTLMKGVAILMMLFLHLFRFHGDDIVYKGEIIDIIINDEPFVYYLSNAANPVHIFLIVSGYGLCYQYQNGMLNYINQLRRIIKLYIVYWIIIALFVIISCFIRPNLYVIDFPNIMGNVIGYSCSFNLACWFLLPYAILAILSPWVIRLMISWPALGGAISLVLFLLGGYIISNYMNVLGNFPLVKVFFELLFFVFSFYIGVFMAYRKITPNLPKQKSFYLILLLVTVTAEIFINSASTYPIYAVLLIICILNLRIEGWLKRLLISLGKYSMPIWFIHMFYSFYIFPEFFYGFRYPILILGLLTLVSYVTAVSIMKVISKVKCFLFI